MHQWEMAWTRAVHAVSITAERGPQMDSRRPAKLRQTKETWRRRMVELRKQGWTWATWQSGLRMDLSDELW